ncbi:MAG: aliphatic sulfonate ABC transporter substrate-binding protein [Angustibacter sp.]
MRSLRLLAVVAVAAVGLSACGALDEGGSDSAKAAPKGSTQVRVGYLHTIAVDDKLALGLNKGYWADQGLDVKATKFDTGIAVSQALAGGSIDVAIMGGVTSNFPARGQGKIFMLNSLETATAQLWVQPNSKIKSVKDLRGKTIATTEGTTADVYLYNALKKAGLSRKDVKVVNAAMPNSVQAFVSGSVDAIALWVPFDLRLKEARPGATMIDNAGNYPDTKIADGWIANNDWFAKNPAVVEKIVKGWLKANEEFRKNPDESLKTVQETWYAQDAKLSDLQHQVQFQTDYTNDEWRTHYENGDVQKWVGDVEKAYVALGGVPTYVDPKTFFDTSLFLKASGSGQ